MSLKKIVIQVYFLCREILDINPGGNKVARKNKKNPAEIQPKLLSFLKKFRDFQANNW
jgi:hypothetical protein